MTEELRDQLTSLRNVAPMLNKATDEATAVVKSVDAFLKNLNLGLTEKSKYFDSVFLTRDDPEADEAMIEGMDNDNRYSKDCSLRYGRINGEFAIHVIAEILAEDIAAGYGGSEWKLISYELIAWPSVPRPMKLKAVVELPSLLANIEAQARKLATAATEASGFTRSVLESLGADHDVTHEVSGAAGATASLPRSRKK